MQQIVRRALTSAVALAGAFLILQPAASNGANTSTFVLLTETEVQEWRTYSKDHFDADSPHSKSLSAAPLTDCHAAPEAAAMTSTSPQINILHPSLANPLSAPIDIDVAFVAVVGAPIRPDSFRVCYVVSFFTKDITDRIMAHASISAEGIHVAGAQLPRGHHHLVLLIADEQGHTGRREASFEIK